MRLQMLLAPGAGVRPEDWMHGEEVEAMPSAGQLRISDLYAILRGAIGQMAGAMLIYRHGHRSLDVVAAMVADAEERTTQCMDMLAEATVPQRQLTIRNSCVMAAELMQAAAAIIRGSMRVGGGGLDEAERALQVVRRAYGVLAAAADRLEGCGMIAFEACCCFGAIKTVRCDG